MKKKKCNISCGSTLFLSFSISRNSQNTEFSYQQFKSLPYYTTTMTPSFFSGVMFKTNFIQIIRINNCHWRGEPDPPIKEKYIRCVFIIRRNEERSEKNKDKYNKYSYKQFVNLIRELRKVGIQKVSDFLWLQTWIG